MTGKSKCIAHRPNWLPSDFGAAKVVVRISFEYGIVFPCWVGVLAASVQAVLTFCRRGHGVLTPKQQHPLSPQDFTRRQHPSYQLPQQAQ
jgi:hypothetical protein